MKRSKPRSAASIDEAAKGNMNFGSDNVYGVHPRILRDDLWLQNARVANALAQNLANGIKQLPSVRVSQPTQANEVFAFMPKKLVAKLEDKGAIFYEWPGSESQEGEIHVRFVLSFATPPEHVEKFVDLARRLT
jgi:threonine aldolase